MLPIGRTLGDALVQGTAIIPTKLRVRARHLRLPFFTLIGTCLLLVGLSVPVASSRPLATATRPNIVVIMTDDQTVEQLRVMSKVRA
jgi:hypothetical protein